MLNSECLFLLNFIKNNSLNGYFVEEIEVLVNNFPSFYKVDKNSVLEMLSILKTLGYISVKYNDGEKVCIMSTERGSIYLQSLGENASDIKVKNLAGWAFFGSILGGFLGSVISNFIAILMGV